MSCLPVCCLRDGLSSGQRRGRTQVSALRERARRGKKKISPASLHEGPGFSSYGRAGKRLLPEIVQVVQTGGNLPAIQGFSGGKAFDRPGRAWNGIMSMNAVVISLFLGGLALCIVTGASLLWALAFGLLCFTGHAFRLGFRPREIVGLCGRGVRTIGNILKIFVLIGMLTAVWRSAGTIPYIIHHCLPWVDPAHFHLWVFLLCSLLSLLLGTSFGTASTLGVVFMLLARTAGLDPLLTAGAVMSGIYVGDRSSPMSSSAALVCALTGTSIYDNVRLMWRTSLLPFFLVCLAYVLLPSARAESLPHVDGLFADGLVLDVRALLPAVFMLVPLLLRWDVKKIMACSILAGCVVSLAVQQMAPAALLRCLVLGYEPPAGMEMLSGGGLLSMAQVAGIVLLTSAYAGLLEATGLLDGLSSLCKRLSLRLGAFRTTVLAGLPVAAVSCNQTLGIMLTKQLCAPLWQNGKEMVLPLENGIALLAAIIPWSIAGSVPCAIMGVGPECLPYAFYLYMVPLTDMLLRRR